MDHCLENSLSSLFSEEMKKFLKVGPAWKSAKEMQNLKTLEEKGWKVKVYWDDEFVDGVCVGIGVFAGQRVPVGSVLRRGVTGKNVLFFNQHSNLPNVELTPTVEYLRKYVYNCPCKEHMAVWFPGNSVNHSIDANVINVTTEESVDLVAIKSIEEGENLRYDYRTFGKAPDWFVDMLYERTGNKECVFKGYNHYVI